MFSRVHETWMPVLEGWKAEGGDTTLQRVAEARTKAEVFPKEEDVFAALQMPLTSVKVVLLAQDPYHGEGQAMGLAFSVPNGFKHPPSLVNIRKEFLTDVGNCWPSGVSDLTPWVHQGILLLNTVLTVEKGKANSHATWGWETCTKRILEAVALENPEVVFIAWGKNAYKMAMSVVGKDRVVDSPHPSPLSAHRGFFGSKPFSKANALLSTPIDWSLC